MANKYLGVLSDLRIVEREIPITEEKPLKSKKGLYRITDEFFQFWFKFIWFFSRLVGGKGSRIRGFKGWWEETCLSLLAGAGLSHVLVNVLRPELRTWLSRIDQMI